MKFLFHFIVALLMQGAVALVSFLAIHGFMKLQEVVLATIKSIIGM